jgi:hypothetical protein
MSSPAVAPGNMLSNGLRPTGLRPTRPRPTSRRPLHVLSGRPSLRVVSGRWSLHAVSGRRSLHVASSSPLKNRSAGPPSPAHPTSRAINAGLGGPALQTTPTPTAFQPAPAHRVPHEASKHRPLRVTSESPAGTGRAVGPERRAALAALAEKVRQLQASRRGTLERCPTGLRTLDDALGGGFALGCVHELLAPAQGTAALSLALWAAVRCLSGTSEEAHPSNTTAPSVPPRTVTPALTAQSAQPMEAAPLQHAGRIQLSHSLCYQNAVGRKSAALNPRASKLVFFIDTAGDFYPPAATAFGLPLERLLIIRAPRTTEALWVCEQALRCKAVAAVILPIRNVDAYVSRRLQLAAETGGGLGFLVRSNTRGGQTFAATRLRLDPLPSRNPTPRSARDGATAGQQFDPRANTLRNSGGDSVTRRLRVTLLKLRDGHPADPFELALPLTPPQAAIPESLRQRSPRRASQWPLRAHLHPRYPSASAS